MNDEVASPSGQTGSISTKVRISKLFVTVAGDLDRQHVEFTNGIDLALARNSDVRSIVVDLSNVSHIGHSGLSVLLKMALDHKDLDVSIQNPSEAVASLLEITGLSPVLPVATSGSRSLTDRAQP